MDGGREKKGEKGKGGGEREGAQREEVRGGLLVVLDCISGAYIFSSRVHLAPHPKNLQKELSSRPGQ